MPYNAYNNNTSSGHERKHKKAARHECYAEERKERDVMARLAEWERKKQRFKDNTL